MSSQLKYENIQVDDHDDLSITEVDESLMGDEKDLNTTEFQNRYQKRSKRVRCLSILKEARWFIDTILLVFIVVILLRGQSRNTTPKTSEHEVGGDITGLGPHCKILQQN